MCVVLKIAGFKSQYKPVAFLCRKTLPLVCKAYHLQREFARTPPHWGVRMATWTRCPIHTPHKKLPCLFLNISLLIFFWKCVDSKTTIPYCPSLGFFSHWLTASLPQSLVTVESYSFLFLFCNRLIINNHCGSSDIHQLVVSSSSDVENFNILLHCRRHSLHKTM